TAPTSLLEFEDAINSTGVYYLTDVLSESIKHAVISNAGTPVINDLKIQGGRLACDATFWDLDAATDLKNLGLHDVSVASIGFTVEVGSWCRITGNFFSAAISVSGTSTDAELIAVGNTINGDFFVSGTFGDLVYLNQANVVDTATVTRRIGVSQSLRPQDRPAFAGADLSQGTLATRVETSASLGDRNSTVNNQNKAAGVIVYNITTGRPMWSTGSIDNDWWVYAEGVDGSQIQPT
ncbi:MAG: hypothetical protein AAFY47_05330, partial [Pseudomonadota bacterium]